MDLGLILLNYTLYQNTKQLFSLLIPNLFDCKLSLIGSYTKWCSKINVSHT